MRKFKDIKIYIINALLVLFLFLAILWASKIYPFGNNALGISDALLQFKPMLYEFIMKIKTGTLLNYSFNHGLGNPTIFNYLYYLKLLIVCI